MTVELQHFVDSQQNFNPDDPQIFADIVQELRETAEDVRVREVSPHDRRCMVLAAEFLVGDMSPVKDELDTLIAVSASTAVVQSQKLEEAYFKLLDTNFPIDATVSPNALVANEQSRQQFENARNTTDIRHSFGSALIHAIGYTEESTGIGTDKDLLAKELLDKDERGLRRSSSKSKAKKIPESIKQLLYEDLTPRTLDSHGLFGGDHRSGYTSNQTTRPEIGPIDRISEPTGTIDMSNDLRDAA